MRRLYLKSSFRVYPYCGNFNPDNVIHSNYTFYI